MAGSRLDSREFNCCAEFRTHSSLGALTRGEFAGRTAAKETGQKSPLMAGAISG